MWGAWENRRIEASWDQVRARRLLRSSLVERAGADQLVEVAHAVCGVHAQVQASAELQLGARLDGIVQGDVRAALWEQRALVKAWTVRGTLHLHPARELPLWLAARRAVTRSLDAGLPAWRDPAGVLHPALAAEQVETVRAAVWDELDDRCLLRDELVSAVAKRVPAAARARLRSGFAFFLGELCQGPPKGARTTLARPDQWIGGWRDVADADEALREVCRRFLSAYGPARPVDFSEWFAPSALKVAGARKVFDELASDLDEITVAGQRRFVLKGDTSFPTPIPHVRLLPQYDVYVMGFRERDQLVPDPVQELIAADGRGRYEGPAGVRIVLVDGVAAGVWERKKRGRRLDLHVRLVRRLDKAHRAELEHEAERLGAFLMLGPVLTHRIEPTS